jgi:hypothetical protein
VVVGRVEGREVVVLELDLGTLGDAESEAHEDVLDLALHLRQQVGRAARHGIAGQRHVDGRGLQLGVELPRLEAIAQLAVQLLERGAHAVQLLAPSSPQLCGEIAQLAQGPGERTRAAQGLDARVLELDGRGRALELLAPLLFERGRVVH